MSYGHLSLMKKGVLSSTTQQKLKRLAFNNFQRTIFQWGFSLHHLAKWCLKISLSKLLFQWSPFLPYTKILTVVDHKIRIRILWKHKLPSLFYNYPCYQISHLRLFRLEELGPWIYLSLNKLGCSHLLLSLASRMHPWD